MCHKQFNTSDSLIRPAAICSSLISRTAKICPAQYLKLGLLLSVPIRSSRQMNLAYSSSFKLESTIDC